MANTYTLIDKSILTTSQSSVTFSSIPQTYKDLKVVMSWRNTADGAEQSNAYLTFNGTTSRYYEFMLYTPGVTGAAVIGRQNTFPYITWGATGNGSTSTASTFSNSEFYVPNYTSSNAKPVAATGLQANNSANAWILITGALWDPTTNAPITSITLTAGSNSMAQHSSFYLYGIKNS
jgi:hypothetical protein